MPGIAHLGRFVWNAAIAAMIGCAAPAIASAPLTEGTVPPPDAAPTDSLPRAVAIAADEALRMTLPVYVSGQGPYPFLIDTGSQRTLLSTELAQMLTLPAGQIVRIVSMAGPARLPSVTIPHLRYGKEEVRDIKSPTIAQMHLGGPGILGLDGLQGKRLVLNFGKQRMEVDDGRRRSRETDDGTIVVEARSRLGQLILVNCEVGGQRTSVILDTGAQYSVGNLALLRKLRADRLVLQPQPVQITSVTGETIEAQLAIVKKVVVSEIILHDVPIVFTDAAPFRELKLAEKPSMLLGMQILRLFDRIAIDFEQKQVDFMPKAEG